MEGVIAVDLVSVVDPGTGEHMVTRAWGDPVELVGETASEVRVALKVPRTQRDGSLRRVEKEGVIKRRSRRRVVVPRSEAKVLKMDFVDVQQGDGALVETPQGKVMLVDGGENQLFARYLASRFAGASADDPRPVECIVVSHGDADHFAGLAEIAESEQHPIAHKRAFVQPRRVFHNGIVKRPSSRPDEELLGRTATIGGRLAVVDLVDDLRETPDAELNKHFKRWKRALEHWGRRDTVELRRLARGDDDAFDFLADEGIQVEVLGPIPVTGGGRSGFPFLSTPERRFGHPSRQPRAGGGSPSASHTINGHSIVLRVSYGRWSMLFAGDLNEEAERVLADAHRAGDVDLRSEVLKVPHHGSADFLLDFLQAVEPLVSVVSSGDEDSRREHIHPRATLMSALGRFGRPHEPVVFVTELVAFFRAEGWVRNAPPDDGERWGRRRSPFFAFSRESYGAVRVRTDGERLLVYTDSGKPDMKEAYAYTLEADGTAVPQRLLRA